MTLSAFSGFKKLTRFLPGTRSLLSSSAPVGFLDSTPNARAIERSLFLLRPDSTPETAVKVSWLKMYRCGIHTKGGDKEYAASLKEEISKETQSQTTPILKVEDFDCKYDGADVTLSKSLNNKIITITANLSHSVYDWSEIGGAETDWSKIGEAETDRNKIGGAETTELRSTPDFVIDVEKGEKMLTFECRFVDTTEEEEIAKGCGGPWYLYSIALYEDETETCIHQLFDGDDRFENNVRDVAVKYLKELGISNDFVDELMWFYTSYELELYTTLFQKMKALAE